MKIKNFAIGALAAAMLFTGTSVMEAAVYNTSASRLPTDIDSRCGRTEAFLLKNTRFDVKHTMTEKYAEEYVAPCFSRKGIYISSAPKMHTLSLPAKAMLNTETTCLPKVCNTPINEYPTSTANLKTWKAIGLPA